MSKIMKDKKTAVILFNLGGPENQEAVKPFLFNLFNDKYIITAPKLIRYFLAKLISTRREKTAQEIYSLMGGGSSILPETIAQKEALEQKLQKEIVDSQFKVFICMRHWHPMTEEVVKQIEAYNPSEIITLPLYPQFSTTTTLSSIEEFENKIKKSISKKATLKNICCYPDDKLFASAYAKLLSKSMQKIKNKDNAIILFSAHGLPEKVIKSGDSYQWQVELSVKSIVNFIEEKFEYKTCYQSKVGPLKWIGPSTEDEIESAAKQGKEIIVVPVAFVSEHSETSVELDIEYKEIADRYKASYIRVETVSVHEDYIKSLANSVLKAYKKEGSFTLSSEMKRKCLSAFGKCPCKTV